MKTSQLRHFIHEQINESIREYSMFPRAQGNAPNPQHPRFREGAQKEPGTTWQSEKNVGAKSPDGRVRYFTPDKESEAREFAASGIVSREQQPQSKAASSSDEEKSRAYGDEEMRGTDETVEPIENDFGQKFAAMNPQEKGFTRQYLDRLEQKLIPLMQALVEKGAGQLEGDERLQQLLTAARNVVNMKNAISENEDSH